MRSPTFTRGALLACATSLLLALTAPATALAAGTGASKDAYGQDTPVNISSSSATAHASSGSFGGSIIRTIVGLAIVIAVIYGLTWVIRQSKSTKTAATGDGLAQVASLPLGTGRSLALVRVGDELHLLGVAEGGVTGIRVFNEDEAYELGLPFQSDDDDLGAGGGAPITRVVDSLRRFTVR